MATTPKKKPQDRKKPSTAADFKKKRQGTFELPSGAIATLRNPGGLRIFMQQGAIPNSLMPQVQAAIQDGEKPNPEDFKLESVNDDTVEEMMQMMDMVAVACFVEPKCYNTPENEDDRDPDKLYADEVEDQDKMFIFQWITRGVSDLETFREEQAANVAAVAGQSKVGS